MTVSFDHPATRRRAGWVRRLAEVAHDEAAARPYIVRMHFALGLLLFAGTILVMEAVAYAAHRWVMHGPGWFLHRSHHRHRSGRFEANDLYAVIFALPSIALLYLGVQGGWGDWAAWVGAGIAGYGAIYFGFHDVIVHKRITHRFVPRSSYFRRIVQAHRLHHAVDSREGAVSFGFIWAPRPDTLKARLDKQRLRAPAERP
jgi:beta-carotene 3-hydroxylase